MEPLEYLHLQMRLEGKEVIHERLLRQVEALPDEELPWMLIAQLANHKLIEYYAEFILPDLQEQLAASMKYIEFPAIEPLFDIFRNHHEKFEVGHFKTYVFPSILVKDPDARCFSKYDPKVKAFGFNGLAEQVYAIERNGRIVSACVSTRENEKCGEAWVYTLPEYRRQGLAQNVVSAWAGSLTSAGKVPFYSHKIENTASANLARKLGLQPAFEEISITHIPAT